MSAPGTHDQPSALAVALPTNPPQPSAADAGCFMCGGPTPSPDSLLCEECLEAELQSEIHQ